MPRNGWPVRSCQLVNNLVITLMCNFDADVYWDSLEAAIGQTTNNAVGYLPRDEFPAS